MSVDPAGRDGQALRDLVEFGELAVKLVDRGRAAYHDDRLLQLSAEAILSRIGEAVARLDPGLIASHPNVPFRQAKGMRNLVAHEYHRVDPDLVWNVLENRIPDLCAEVRRILDEPRDGRAGG